MKRFMFACALLAALAGAHAQAQNYPSQPIRMLVPFAAGGTADIIGRTVGKQISHVKAGRLRALAVTSAKRSAGIPDVPTVGENGLPGYGMTAWHGLMAPRNTPPRVIALLHKTVTDGIASREMRDLFIGMGLDPVGDSPAQHKAFISNEIRKISKLVKDADLKPE
jgi:tripartite-type tricarboxylate transporter receptor subunit TctC